MASYVYKGNKYVFQSEATRKDPITRDWVEVVTYTSYEDPTKIFVRDKKEFYERFKPYTPEDNCLYVIKITRGRLTLYLKELNGLDPETSKRYDSTVSFDYATKYSIAQARNALLRVQRYGKKPKGYAIFIEKFN